MSRRGQATWVFAAMTLLSLGAAGSTDKVTLRDFLIRYLKTDKGIAASLLRLEAAKGKATATAYLSGPSLRVDLASPYYSWMRSYAYEYYLDDLYRGYLESKDRSYRLSLSLKQRLPTGGDISIKGSTHRARTSFSYSGFPPEIPIARETGDRQFLTDVGVSIDQPIFGLWQRKSEIKKVSLQYGSQQAQHKLDGANSLKRAINIFFDYLTWAYRLKIEEHKLERATHDAASGARQFDEGLISEIELLERRVAANNAQMAHHKARAALDQALIDLKVVQPSGPADLIPQDLSLVAPVDASEAGVARSPQVIKAQHEVEIARLSLAETKRRRFGQTTLSLWYGFQGLGDDFAESRDEFRNNRWGGSLSLGLTLPEPGIGSDIDLAKASLETAESAHEAAIQTAAAERDRLDHEVNSLKANFELQTRQTDLLEVLLATKRGQYDGGVILLEDLIESEVDLLEARIRRLETMRSLSLAWVDLTLYRGENPIEVLRGKE